MENIIEIPIGNTDTLIEVINRFNETYKTDFKFLHSEDRDGVEFGIVKKGIKCSNNMVFMLGFFFCGKISSLRARGEIDW